MLRMVGLLLISAIFASPAIAQTQRLTHDGFGTIVFDLPDGWALLSDKEINNEDRVFEFISPADATPMSWDQKVVVSFSGLSLPADSFTVALAAMGQRSWASRCLPVAARSPSRQPDTGLIIAANYDIACEVRPEGAAPPNMYLRGVEVVAATVFGYEGEKGLVTFEYFQHFGTRGSATDEDKQNGNRALHESRAFIDEKVIFCPSSVASDACSSSGARPQ